MTVYPQNMFASLLAASLASSLGRCGDTRTDCDIVIGFPVSGSTGSGDGCGAFGPLDSGMLFDRESEPPNGPIELASGWGWGAAAAMAAALMGVVARSGESGIALP